MNVYRAVLWYNIWKKMFENLISKMSPPVSVFGVVIFGGAISGIDCTLTFFGAIGAGLVMLAVMIVNGRTAATHS